MIRYRFSNYESGFEFYSLKDKMGLVKPNIIGLQLTP